MSTESREASDSFSPAEPENKHWYDCDMCGQQHLVDDDAGAFDCPNTHRERSVILFV